MGGGQEPPPNLYLLCLPCLVEFIRLTEEDITNDEQHHQAADGNIGVLQADAENVDLHAGGQLIDEAHHGHAQLGTLIGCFQDSSIPGKVQHGSAWWFNDNKTGMQDQMTSLGNLGLLGNFIGMLTDSRSFLSYTRHEYFRRILCDLVGRWVENGEYPNNEASLKKIIEGISSYNAIRYFGL